MSLPTAVFDAAADGYDLDEHHVTVADQLVAGVRRADAGALVIDVATGTGAAAFAALRRVAPGRVLAVDMSLRMLDRARAKAAHCDPEGRIEWRAAPAVLLDIDDGSADVVLCASSLHFLGLLRSMSGGECYARAARSRSVSLSQTDFTPTPSFHAVLADDLIMPSDGSQAAKIALGTGFQRVIVRLSAVASQGRPRRAFLVWAQAPPQT
ncbi:MAG: class I SAM-dependent methyltransferase [Pseudonocardiaceae bacterium]